MEWKLIDNVLNKGTCDQKLRQGTSVNYIAKSLLKKAGDGVFAGKHYSENDLVEMNPFIEYEDNRSGLQKYCFESPMKSEKQIIVLGNGSMMNHSYTPNVEHVWNEGRYIMYVALRKIDKDEELLINYGERYWS